jgi:hypothetical protein
LGQLLIGSLIGMIAFEIVAKVCNKLIQTKNFVFEHKSKILVKLSTLISGTEAKAGFNEPSMLNEKDI